MEIQDIKSIEIFADLSPEELDEMIPIIHSMRVLEGEPLTRDGDAARRLFIVVSGNFMVYFNDGRAFTLHHKGDIIGGGFMIPALNHDEVSAVALTDGEILTIPEADLLRLLEANADLAPRIMERIHHHVHQGLAMIDGLQPDME